MKKSTRTLIIVVAGIISVVLVTTTPATWVGWFHWLFGWPQHYTPTISSGAEG